MDSPAPGSTSRDRGLPPGVDAAPIVRRFFAFLIDLLVPAAAGALMFWLAPGLTQTARLVLAIGCTAAVLGWAVLVWFMLAERAATPGMRVLRLQLVGYYDGRPIGWGRVLLRTIVFYLLVLSAIGLLIMLVLMIIHPRHQGWHDLVVQAVMIKERVLAPPQTQKAARTDRQAVGYQTEPQPAVSYEPERQPVVDYEPVPVPAPSPVSYGPQARYSPVPGPAASPAPLTPPAGDGGYPPAAPYPPDYLPQSAPSAPSDVPAEVGAFAEPTAPQNTVSPSAYAPVGPYSDLPSWVAVMDDGRRITVEGLVLLGRNPQPQPGEEDAHLIKLADETRTVSKSHLAIAVDDAGGVYVVDRGSTNGSTVTNTSGQSTRCTPGVRVYVDAGTIISIGDHWLELRRS